MGDVKDFLTEEQADQGDDVGLQRQLDQCSVSFAKPPGTNNIFCFFFVIAVLIKIIRRGIETR